MADRVDAPIGVHEIVRMTASVHFRGIGRAPIRAQRCGGCPGEVSAIAVRSIMARASLVVIALAA
ncbi:MAG: hypothetical protein ABL897_05020, partial [Hyphomicrobium sp.]